MSRHRRSLAACVGVLALLLAPAFTAPVAAQATSPLLGTWSIVWGIGNRIESGVETPIKATGRLVIVSAGDSLLATVTTLSRDDGSPPRPPMSFSGKATAGGAEFTQRSEATMNMNGDVRKVPSVAKWVLSLDGQTLRGTISRELIGVEIPPSTSELTGTKSPD
jgi:hypothetical protein